MMKRTGLACALIGAAMMAFGIPGTSSAQTSCDTCSENGKVPCAVKSFDAAAAKCRKALSKNVGKIQKTAAKNSASCHKGRLGGKVDASVDCNDPAQADPKGKLSGAIAKFSAGIGKSCPSTIGNTVLSEYLSCPEPCATSTGASNPLASYTELADCLGCVAAEQVAARGQAMLGNPTAPNPDKAAAGCHATFSKSFDKYLATLVKNRSKCQDTAEAKAGACGFGSSNCYEDDSKGKIAGALAKAEAGVSGKCAGVDFSQFNLGGSCSAVTNSTEYNSCASSETTTAGQGTLSDIYSLPAAGLCPTVVQTTISGAYGIECTTNADCLAAQECLPAGGSVSRCQTETRLDVGWTGQAHNVDTVDGYTVASGVTCPESSVCSDNPAQSCTTNGDCADECVDAAPCGLCTLDGISSNSPQYASFLRCEADTAIPCSTPFASDPAACGALTSDLCGYYLGPPLPLSSANSPVCSLLRIDQDITGAANPDTGDTDFTVNMLSKVHLGIGQTQPCPLCIGDTIPLDGVKSGTCDYGTESDSHAGQPCDVMGFQGTFANDDEGLGLSLDCPPSPGKNISGAGLIINLDFTTGSTSLPFGVSCDAPLGAFSCACGQCDNDTTRPCNADSDCEAPGTCSTNGGGAAAARQPNGCADLNCIDSGDGNGTCDGANPANTLTYCDGDVRASGAGYLSCSSNADCVSSNSICNGGDCGNCTLTRVRPCFNDPVTFEGIANPEFPVLAATFCLPPTTNGAINAVSGSPGPARVRVQQTAVRKYD